MEHTFFMLYKSILSTLICNLSFLDKNEKATMSFICDIDHGMMICVG